jgi:hypothetical protein
LQATIWFEAQSALAEKLSIDPLIIGLTIVAFGTSAPELFVSLQAAFDGVSGIAIGNVVGSNIANVLLVLGAPALLMTINCREGRPRQIAGGHDRHDARVDGDDGFGPLEPARRRDPAGADRALSRLADQGGAQKRRQSFPIIMTRSQAFPRKPGKQFSSLAA